MVTLNEIKVKVIQVWESDHIILPSVTAAQFVLESASGTSSLAKKANNFFGIKASAPWAGPVEKITSNEEIDGKLVPRVSEFRKYGSWEESVQDHSDFFVSTAFRKLHYAAVIGETDYKKVCNTLAKTYATDSSYGTKLIAIIENNGLDAWDLLKEETNVVRVYISPSSQDDNVGVGNFGTEEIRMNQVADVVEAELKRVGITTLRNTPNMDITQMVATSNAFGADVHLSIHSNAGGATGAEAYYYTGSSAGQKLAQSVYDNLVPMTPTADRGIKATTQLYEVWATNAVATLVEIAFHDNATDAAFIINNIQAIGIALAKGVCSYLGIDFGSSNQATTAAESNSLVYVDYNATIMEGGYSVDSKPWGEPGAETWSNTTDWMYKTVHFREESADGAYANGDYFGWVDKRALGKARKNARYTATVISGGFSVDSLPWGEKDYYQLGLTDNHVYSVVTVLMESANGEYAYIRNDEKEIGWVDKKALAEGIIAKPEVAPEPVVVPSPSFLHLPGGEEWVMYPSEGPYQAGDVISLEDAAAYTVLGERNGGKVLIVELENFGVVGIRFDADKGATIENK